MAAVWQTPYEDLEAWARASQDMSGKPRRREMTRREERQVEKDKEFLRSVGIVGDR